MRCYIFDFNLVFKIKSLLLDKGGILLHEFSTAQTIFNTVIEVAKENNGKKVERIVVEVGEFALLNTDQVTFWLEVLGEKTIAEGMKVEFVKIPGKIRCEKCGYNGTVKSPTEEDIALHTLVEPSFSCPKCESKFTEILAGREVILKNVIITK